MRWDPVRCPGTKTAALWRQRPDRFNWEFIWVLCDLPAKIQPTAQQTLAKIALKRSDYVFVTLIDDPLKFRQALYRIEEEDLFQFGQNGKVIHNFAIQPESATADSADIADQTLGTQPFPSIREIRVIRGQISPPFISEVPEGRIEPRMARIARIRHGTMGK